jgi:hypothetical protein
MLGRGGLAGYRCAEIALRRRIFRHTVLSRLSYAWVSASEMDCNRSLLERDFSFPLSEFMGLVRYRTVQKHAFPGPPRPKSVRIASCAHPAMPGRSVILDFWRK